MRLVGNVYGTELRPTVGPFGMSSGQIRGHDLVHNGSWFNRAGEKLGWGDLSPLDLLRIAVELEGDEAFIVLSESDAYWSFVTRIHVSDVVSHDVLPDEQCPGRAFIAERGQYVVLPCRILYVDRYGQFRTEGTDPLTPVSCDIEGVPMEAVTREYVMSLLA
ncbi:hypothetical protein L0Y59_02700 [Candidatus Uhrbacteria bacterium]|nr:hypothetical protein [Candidatus Uhrbacteria bacterium]